MTRTVHIAEVVTEPTTWNPRESGASEAFRYIDIACINPVDKSIGEVPAILPALAPSRARQLVRSDDVLVSTVRPNLNAVAVVPAELDGATASTGFAVLRPDTSRIYSRYLYYWVRTPEFVRTMVWRATGASYPAVTESVVRESTIPLPPLAEQRRIATMLDKVDGVRRKRGEAIRLLDKFLRSAFLEMFGDPVRNEKGWEVVELGDTGTFVGGGTPSRAIPHFWEGSICWASSKDIVGEELAETQEHVTPEAVDRSAARVVPAGTILMVVKSKILMHRLPVAVARVPVCFSQDIKGLLMDEARLSQ